ncbi:hypothetical protein GQ55_1G080400 [Panicum hallii var. hallii]|uniref:Uncharacterized protein n=1 Tax=Panicum hallii var. hallii TaxID=1504633 RepID=A0A2T7F3G7_9POAL|nr:hypothetical protein GQ55_1G080400 [Panicum hallii var. hallii]
MHLWNRTSGVHPGRKHGRGTELACSSSDCAPAVPLLQSPRARVTKHQSPRTARMPPALPRRGVLRGACCCRAADLSTSTPVRTDRPAATLQRTPRRPVERASISTHAQRLEQPSVEPRALPASTASLRWRQLTTDPSTWEAGTRLQN